MEKSWKIYTNTGNGLSKFFWIGIKTSFQFDNEAITYLMDNIDKFPKGDYVILPTYTKN